MFFIFLQFFRWVALKKWVRRFGTFLESMLQNLSLSVVIGDRLGVSDWHEWFYSKRKRVALLPFDKKFHGEFCFTNFLCFLSSYLRRRRAVPHVWGQGRGVHQAAVARTEELTLPKGPRNVEWRRNASTGPTGKIHLLPNVNLVLNTKHMYLE